MVAEPTSGTGNPNQPPDLSGLCRAVTGHAPWPMAAVEGARHIVRSVNPAFCRLMDKPTEQLVGKPFYELLPAKDESEKLLDRVFQTGNSETYTEEKYPDLHPVFWSYAAWPVWESERPVGLMIQVTETAQLHEKTLAMNEALILGSVHQHELTEAADLSNAQLQEEIGERRNTVRELSEKARLLDLSNDAIIVRDPEGRIVYWNHGAEELYGWLREEALGKVSHTLLQTEFPKPIEQITEEFHRKDRWTGELVHTKRNGERITVLARKALDRDAQGNPAAVLQTITDISGRKRTEEQLKASVKQTVDLNNEIQGFYHTLSHELKTPLTSAREFVSIVMDGLAGPLNATQLEYLGIAKESCDQLRLYINDLLDVTRLETGKMSIEFHALPLAPLVERVVEMLAPAAAGKGVSLSSDCQPDLPSVPIDKQRILQVLINLTTNAIKFTPAGGQICLGLSETPAHPECLQIAVRDTGRGIPKDHLDMIFDRRYQANHNAQSIESQSGLGLGLYICHELVGLHGGRIWVESEVGKGSTFSFVIPKQAKTKGAYVLIVDDEQQTRELLRHVLEDQDFVVMTAKGGNEALQLMGRRTPDIVVLDLKMAGMDGPSTLKAIRMKWGLIPVIIYTGYPDGELMQQAMESSPFTLLTKSCPSQQFVETVRRMCPAHETRFPEKDDQASQTHAARPSRHSTTVGHPPAAAVLDEGITI